MIKNNWYRKLSKLAGIFYSDGEIKTFCKSEVGICI